MVKVSCLFDTIDKAMVHMAIIAAVNWTNCALKHHCTALSYFTKEISFEDICLQQGISSYIIVSKVGDWTRQLLQDVLLWLRFFGCTPRHSTFHSKKTRAATSASGACGERSTKAKSHPAHPRPLETGLSRKGRNGMKF